MCMCVILYIYMCVCESFLVSFMHPRPGLSLATDPACGTVTGFLGWTVIQDMSDEQGF